MNITGEKIKGIRKRRGLSQEQLSAKYNLLGFDTSRSTLAKIEHNS
ncbi:helix-turn-helix domain-containing protein [Enterovibrio norvegicus]|uniref:Helix-turn-helix domain-containing protein n=1 Tax=Enterovibrio norvegicus DSM 15893 TaxID=1121869 RepID=A0A1I5PHM7_9GAMM|nr:Helix-turn-helix domain-containing protein [Enterovibrio norvegicus DSM 15893]